MPRAYLPVKYTKRRSTSCFRERRTTYLHLSHVSVYHHCCCRLSYLRLEKRRKIGQEKEDVQRTNLHKGEKREFKISYFEKAEINGLRVMAPIPNTVQYHRDDQPCSRQLRMLCAAGRKRLGSTDVKYIESLKFVNRYSRYGHTISRRVGRTS